MYFRINEEKYSGRAFEGWVTRWYAFRVTSESLKRMVNDYVPAASSSGLMFYERVLIIKNRAVEYIIAQYDMKPAQQRWSVVKLLYWAAFCKT